MAPVTSTWTPKGTHGSAPFLHENGPLDGEERPPRSCIDARGSAAASSDGAPGGGLPGAASPDVRMLRRRLRNRNSSARFRERQRSRVDELEAQIAHFQRENHTLERLARELSSQSRAANSIERGQEWSGTDARWGARRPHPPPLVPLQHTVEVLSDEELLSAIHRGGSSTSSAEEC